MSDKKRVAIVGALRTPIGSFLGSLKKISAAELGSLLIQDLLGKTGVQADDVNEVLMGQVYTGGGGSNPARQAALKAGLPHSSLATSINMLCGSGLRSLIMGAQSIQSGQADCIIAGGMESMSQAPFVMPSMREGHQLGHDKIVDSLIHDALWDPFYDCHMGVTAENLAEEYHISREEQDEYAALSQQRCEAAQQEGKFNDEITPVYIPQRKGEAIEFKEDEFPRSGVTAESLKKLKPAFKPDGTVTAANSSGINDGAGALMLV